LKGDASQNLTGVPKSDISAKRVGLGGRNAIEARGNIQTRSVQTEDVKSTLDKKRLQPRTQRGEREARAIKTRSKGLYFREVAVAHIRAVTTKGALSGAIGWVSHPHQQREENKGTIE